jgi:hypothetical protein
MRIGGFTKNSGFAICIRNLRICDSEIGFADQQIICVPTFTAGLPFEKLNRNFFKNQKCVIL